ncbi:MAG: hypothetical protein AB1453_00765 [Chloroflexota bacterium]
MQAHQPPAEGQQVQVLPKNGSQRHAGIMSLRDGRFLTGEAISPTGWETAHLHHQHLLQVKRLRGQVQMCAALWFGRRSS